MYPKRESDGRRNDGRTDGRDKQTVSLNQQQNVITGALLGKKCLTALDYT